MSVRHSKEITSKISRGGSIPTVTKKIKQNPTKTKTTQNKTSKLIEKKRNIKMDYKSNNYFYNDEDNEDEYPENKLKYSQNNFNFKYNNETSDSYITVEQEDGHMKYVPKNYLEYKRSSPPLYNERNDYYQENSEDSDNNYNREKNYDNEYEYDPELINNQLAMNRYNQYNKNKYLTDSNNNTFKKVSKNVISRPDNIQIHYSKDMKRKGRTPNGIINKATTNNTYNNNIYYINPINAKNKNGDNNHNKLKKANANKKNSVYKNVDLTISKKKEIKERDYFKMNNISISQRQPYIKAAILIQSIFRGYLIKIKLYNNVNLYVCCKRSINIIEKIILKRKKRFWKIFRNKITQLYYDDIINSKLSLNILKEYIKTHKDNSKEKKITSFHKELGDSFNIVVDSKEKENTEKKLKSKLNDVIKENKELKDKLVDNKNIEEKMKNLIDENKKNQNINAIIMKDNQQLARKLKDIQDYRNINLFVDNQPSVDFTQKQQMQIDELLKNNEIYLNKLKKCLLGKIINKINNIKINALKDKFNQYRYTVEKMKNKDNELKLKKDLYLHNLVDKIEKQFKSVKQKYFWDLFYVSIILNKDKQFKNELKNESLKNLFNSKEKKVKMILYKEFFKYYGNVIKSKNVDTQKEEEAQEKEESKNIILKKIFTKYENNKKLLYKIFFEKWDLKSRILTMRAAARDKKKKRKLKKKNNKLIYQKNMGLNEKNNNNLSTKFSKSIQEFSYIVSNGAVIKESSSKDLNLKVIKESTSSDKINKKNKLDKKNMGIKKINSVNEIVTHNTNKEDNKSGNKENENVNINDEDFEEDSGDSFGLDDD